VTLVWIAVALVFAIAEVLTVALVAGFVAVGATGAAGMIGQTALVVDPIRDAHHRGHVRIAGEDWPALTSDGRPVEAGEAVRIVEIRRATLVVEPVPGGPAVPEW